MLNLLNILNLRYHLLRLNELDLLNHRNAKNKPLSTFHPMEKQTLEKINLFMYNYILLFDKKLPYSSLVAAVLAAI